MPRRNQDFQTIRSEGGLLPPDLLRRVIDPKAKLEGTTPQDYGLPPGERLNEAVTQSWNRLRKHWADFRASAKNLPPDETGTGLTNDKWSVPLLRELGFGMLPASVAPEIDGKTYAINRFFGATAIHLIGCGLSLDRRAAGVRGAAVANPHGLVQDFLNRSDAHLWAILSNGLRLRILRDSQAISRQSYLEFDLEAMFDGEVFSDFVLLWFMAHATRFAAREGERPETCWLEQWTKEAEEQGTRALGDLKQGVEKALEILGQGFVGHPKNTALRDALRTGSLPLPEFHGQLLRIVYRLIFLFVAEDRTLEGQPLLHTWDDSEAARIARERYAEHYSAGRLREMAGAIRGSRHGDLWWQLNLVVGALSGEGQFKAVREQLALPVLGSFLWSPDSTAALNAPSLAQDGGTELANADLLDAIRNLAFTRQNHLLRPVDYKNLGAEELGGVYESLLALTPQVSGDGAKFTFAEFAGNERKTSGSYYTPDSLVQCLLDSALDPVVDEAIKGKSGAAAERAILALKVCDPAVGSGHFLVGAAHRLARHLARIRATAQGEGEPSPGFYQHALRDVIGRCLYGVDINPMAAELCRVSLWLEALDPGKPLSFLDHHIRVGNSLLGTTPELIAGGLPDDAFTAIEGDDKKTCTQLKKKNKAEREGFSQGDLLGGSGFVVTADVAAITAEARELDAAPDDTTEAIAKKAAQFHRLQVSPEYRHAQLVADTWCAAFVWPKTPEALSKVATTRTVQELSVNAHGLTTAQCAEVERLSGQYQFFHWHLAFPEVFEKGGFDIQLGNPPYIRVQRVDDRPARFLYANFDTATSKTDLSILFMEHCLKHMSPTGRAGLICPSQWLSTDYGEKMRGLLRHGRLAAIIDFGSLPVFAEADTYAAIFVLTGRPVPRLHLKRIRTMAEVMPGLIHQLVPIEIDFAGLSESPWNLGGLDIPTVLASRALKAQPLSRFATPYVGALTGFDGALVVNQQQRTAEALEPDLLVPYAYRGAEVTPFGMVDPAAWIIYPYTEGSDGTPILISEDRLSEAYPNVYAHLLKYRAALEARKDSRRLYATGDHWYKLVRPGSFRYIRPPKILVKGIATRSIAGWLGKDTAFNGANCPGLIINEEQSDARSVTAVICLLLNSRVIGYYLNQVCPPKLGGYFRYNASNLVDIPIPDAIWAHASALSKITNEVTFLIDQQADEGLPVEALALLDEVDSIIADVYGLGHADRELVFSAIPRFGEPASIAQLESAGR
jgi:hypothetical protein